jgi:hypothetical protein
LELGEGVVEDGLFRVGGPDAVQEVMVLQFAESLEKLGAIFSLEVGKFGEYVIGAQGMIVPFGERWRQQGSRREDAKRGAPGSMCGRGGGLAQGFEERGGGERGKGRGGREWEILKHKL